VTRRFTCIFCRNGVYLYIVVEKINKGDELKKIKLNLRKKLTRGTLLWVYADDGKVYHSSKRFDTASFNEHDSNYLGEIEKVSTNKRQLNSLYTMLKKSDRIYGICLNKKGQAAVLNNKTTGDEIIFFPTWEKMTSFGKAHFTITDKIEAETQRKEKARLKWLQRGQAYVNRQNKTVKEA